MAHNRAMTTPFLVLIALLSVVALSALIISCIALAQTRATLTKLTTHEAECRKTDGDIYDRMRTCVSSHNKSDEDIIRALGRIEGQLSMILDGRKQVG